VLGNHDYYLLEEFDEKRFNSSLERIDDMRNWAKEQLNIYCLDGDIVEIYGIKFGGCNSWYDGSYYSNLYRGYNSSIQTIWKSRMNDSKYIKGCCDYFSDLWSEERLKLELIYKKCDVMITHMSPSSLYQYAMKEYRDDYIYSFYCFDGSKYIQDGSMKYWVYGHTHEIKSFRIGDVELHCNAIGYSDENRCFKIDSFEI